MRSAFRKRPKAEAVDTSGGKKYTANDNFRSVDGSEKTTKSSGFYKQLDEKKKKKKKNERKVKNETKEEERRRKMKELATRIETRRMSAQLPAGARLQGASNAQSGGGSSLPCFGARTVPKVEEDEPPLRAEATPAPAATRVPVDRPKPKLLKRTSSFSPDDEPEEYLVTEIQRMVRGKVERRTMREAKSTAEDELRRLKAEYNAKLAALKMQHEAEMRKVYEGIREEHRARSPKRKP